MQNHFHSSLKLPAVKTEVRSSSNKKNDFHSPAQPKCWGMNACHTHVQVNNSADDEMLFLIIKDLWKLKMKFVLIDLLAKNGWRTQKYSSFLINI